MASTVMMAGDVPAEGLRERRVPSLRWYDRLLIAAVVAVAIAAIPELAANFPAMAAGL